MNNVILRWPKVKQLVGLSRPTVWRLENEGNFPKRRKLGTNSVGWMESEIHQWLENRPKVVEVAQCGN